MQYASTQRIYACISIQVTVDHAEHQGEVVTELLKVLNALGKAAFWKSFDLITTTNNDLIGHVQCRIGKHILAHDSKKTGMSHLKRHVERGCATANVYIQLDICGHDCR